MKLTAIALASSFWLAFAMPSVPKDEVLSAKGVVVATQKAKDEIRMQDNTDADLVEVWMVKVGHWQQSQKPGIVLVEYTHHDSVIKDSELDGTTWTFEIRQAPPEKSGTCLSWWAAKRSFVPTAFGRREKLPDPKTLSCFLMTKRPVPVRQGKETSRVDPKDGSHLCRTQTRFAETQLVKAAGSSNFLLVVNCVEVRGGLAACDVRVELRRPADVIAEDGKSILMRGMASVWEKDHLFSGGQAQLSSGIYEYLSQMMAQFAAEYYRQNPS